MNNAAKFVIQPAEPKVMGSMHFTQIGLLQDSLEAIEQYINPN